MNRPHIVVDITAHGFGHLAQMSVVLNQLMRAQPQIRLTVRCNHSRVILERFIFAPFETSPPPEDPGMIMHGPSRIDADASLDIYSSILTGWDEIINDEMRALDALKPDLLVSNVGFFGAAAAGKLGVKAIGLCSLNWLDIFSAYCADNPAATPIISRLEAAYGAMSLFIRPTPSMQMTAFCDQQSVGPICRVREQANPAQVRKIRNMIPTPHIALASLGGIPRDTSWDILPKVDGLTWITPLDAPPGRNDVIDCQSSDLAYFDAFCASDLMVTKTGYGSFTESVCNGVRLLYAVRPDWPESEALEGWAAQNACGRACTQEDLYSGNYLDKLEALLSEEPSPDTPDANGAEEAAGILMKSLN